MKLIVSGPRDLYVTHNVIVDALANVYFDIDEILVGDAKGVDACVREFAARHDIKYTVYTASWEDFGRAAGPIRNREMIQDGSDLCVIRDDMRETRGTENILSQAKRLPDMGWWVHQTPAYEIESGTYIGFGDVVLAESVLPLRRLIRR